MKLINTLYLIAATMVALPTTSAVKMQAKQEPTPGEQLIRIMFDASDSDNDGYLSRDEFDGFKQGMESLYDMAYEVDNADELID